MNGNDYLEIIETQDEQIVKDYVEAIMNGEEEVPDDYKTKWVDLYLEVE